MTVRQFTIDRNEWARGDLYDNRLFNPENGKSCCVGLYLQACDVPRARLVMQATADDLDEVPEEAMWLVAVAHTGFRHPSAAASVVYEVNDSGTSEDEDDQVPITETEREHHVAAVFAQQGITVRFTG